MCENEPLTDEERATILSAAGHDYITWRITTRQYRCIQQWNATVEALKAEVERLQEKLRRRDPELEDVCRCGHTFREHDWEHPCGECSCYSFWFEEGDAEQIQLPSPPEES